MAKATVRPQDGIEGNVAIAGDNKVAVAADGTGAKANRRQILRQYELVDLVRSYDPDVDEDLLNRAYVYAMRAHGTQRRASGDPYFHHPVEVAGILAGLRLDSASIATGLLHDTVEDTSARLPEIETLFGPTVARLVDGVTKLNKIEVQSVQTAQAENFRKLLLAMSEDIRVLLVKLADRLHNMRTLHFIGDEEKRRRISRETMEIYAPLAERIGMERLKTEVEDLAFRELWPDARESIIHRLGQLRHDDTGLIDRVIANLHEILHSAGIEAEIIGREKTPLSIWRKMRRKNVSFEQLSDIMAFRVVVNSVSECYATLGTIHGRYAMLPGRFKDFISLPKPNGYRSLHTTIFGPEQRKIELQIRTHEMHEFAEFGVAAHWAYKQSAKVTDGRQYRWVRELLDILEHTAEPEEFLEHTMLEMLQVHVFCFTPRGDLVALPRGATAVDFAYAVHSEVGDACIGAKVDGKLVQLRTVLQNGDQVEVITSRNSSPSLAWERFVVTGKARARIRRSVRLSQRSEDIGAGREALQQLAKSEGLAVSEKLVEKSLRVLKQNDLDDLYVAIARGALQPRQVLETVRPDLRERARADAKANDNVVVLKKSRVDERTSPTQPVLGLPQGIAYQFANCCRPVRGDPIIGMIRTGKPVTIHRADCLEVTRALPEDQRLVDLDWNLAVKDGATIGRLLVLSLNRP
ncbi:MAG: bifunctional (p)ppGpp synthetase/guanosine-3',5'-bis(diphosphate) 3'-pyrophosphohydrolase, partial [Pseudomonadota bacterium]